MKKRSALGVIFHTLISIVILLAAVWLINYISGYFQNESFLQIVNFLNSNLQFIIAVFLVFFLGEIFSMFMFPFSLIYPMFAAVGGVMTVSFIFSVLELINRLFNSGFYEKVSSFQQLITIIVFVIVIVVGYISILAEFGRKDIEEKEKKRKEGIRWGDVGQEFKFALYEIAYSIRRAFKTKNQENKIEIIKKKKKRRKEE